MAFTDLIQKVIEVMFLAEAQSAVQPLGVIFNPLAVMTWAPILMGVVLLLWKNLSDDTVKKAAIGFTAVLFIASVVLSFTCFDWGNGGFQMTGSADWIKGLGVKYAFGVDSISFSLVLLTTFLFPLTLLGAFGDVKSRVREFNLWMLVLQGALIGTFVARDLVFFFIFFELTLIPLYFMIGVFGGPQKRWAAVKLFIFTLSGSVFTLAGILYVAWFAYSQGGVWTFDIATIMYHASAIPEHAQFWVLMAFLVGFAVKVPLFPVHTWLPLAHTEAPTSGSVMLAGVLLKLGTYGLLRFAIPFAPSAASEYAWVVGLLSVIGILYAALICWVQTDIKKLVAYSSVSHLGFCVLGLFALNVAGIGGSVMYMINHGLSTGALFLCVGMIYERYHTRDMDSLSGLGKRMPIWSFFMVYFCFASVGLPGLNGFVGEFLTMFGAFIATDVLGIAFVVPAALGLIFGAIYILYMVGKVVMGPVKVPEKYDADVKDLNLREIVVLTPLAILCLVLGLYPTPLLRSLEAPIEANIAGVTEALEQRLEAEKQQQQTAEQGIFDKALKTSILVDENGEVVK